MIWGGQASGAGGWNQGIGGSGQVRSSDGWDEEYLGKVYDAEVVRRLLPYLKEWKLYVFASLFCMVLTSIAQFAQPLLIGLVVRSAIRGNPDEVLTYSIVMV